MFCPHCGSPVEESQLFCQHCGAALTAEPVAAETPAAEPEASKRSKTPWEDREQNGFFGGLFQTISNVLTKPTAFYRAMEVRGGFSDPLLFAMIIGMVGVTASSVWQVVLKNTFQAMIPGLPASTPGLQTPDVVFLAFFSPFFLIAGYFLSSGLLHLFLMLVRGANAGFEATFRVVAYAASANILLLIPACGNFLSGVWIVVLLIIGVKEAHEISGGKAAAAVLFPLIACCVFMVLMLALFMGAIAASFGTAMPWMK